MEDGTRRSKDQICREIGAVLLIDDNIVYSSQCAVNGTLSLLFGDYAWNRDASLSYVHNWQSFQRHASSLGSNAFTNTGVQFHSHSMIEHHFTGLKAINSDNSTQDCNVYRVSNWEQVTRALYTLLASGAFAKQTTAPITSIGTSSDGTSAHEDAAEKDVKDKLVIAAIQMCSVADKKRNLETIRFLATKCKAKSPRVEFICLPECCIFMGESSAQTVSISEVIGCDAASEGLQYLCSLAKELSVWFSVGGFPEQRLRSSESQQEVSSTNCMSNTHILINSQGELVKPFYRKIHLFDSPLANLKESQHTGKFCDSKVLWMLIDVWCSEW